MRKLWNIQKRTNRASWVNEVVRTNETNLLPFIRGRKKELHGKPIEYLQIKPDVDYEKEISYYFHL